MRRTISAALIALATLALGLMPVLASAEEAAFKARLTPYAATATQIGPNLTLETVDLTGNGTDLGRCTAAATLYLYLPGDAPWTIWGSMTVTAANGDLLSLDFLATLNPDGTAWVGTYTITGGTGRLLNASGSGDFDVIINFTRPPTWSFDGTIVAPFAS